VLRCVVRVLGGGGEGERLSAGAGIGIGYGGFIPPPSPRPPPSAPSLDGDLEVVGPVEGEEEAGGLVRRGAPAHTELLAVHVQEEGLLRAPLRLHRSHLGGGECGERLGRAVGGPRGNLLPSPEDAPLPLEGEGGSGDSTSGDSKKLYLLLHRGIYETLYQTRPPGSLLREGRALPFEEGVYLPCKHRGGRVDIACYFSCKG